MLGKCTTTWVMPLVHDVAFLIVKLFILLRTSKQISYYLPFMLKNK
jgi:hypothetical protein